MKITVDKNLIDFTPENEEEAKAMTQVWNLVVDCAKFNKKLVPVGEFIPPKSSTARFVIEE